MSTSTTRAHTQDTMVSMGQIAVGGRPELVHAVLGSCIGLTLYHPRIKVGGMAHVVLPDSAGRPGAPGKFADTALPAMLAMLREFGVPGHGLIAKLVGGANMFGSSGPLQIGTANVEAVTRALGAAGVRIVAQDVGGRRGRRVTFDCGGGELTIECAGEPARVL
jgi:chemotaxis protein CheD